MTIRFDTMKLHAETDAFFFNSPKILISRKQLYRMNYVSYIKGYVMI